MRKSEALASTMFFFLFCCLFVCYFEGGEGNTANYLGREFHHVHCLSYNLGVPAL